jgi:uncharacterized protein YqeY
MLMEKVRNDMHDAKKVRNTLKSNLLSTLYSEMFTQSKSGKLYTEEDSIKIIKKFIKNADETLALDIPETAKEKYTAEKKILEGYLPKQLSKEEIEKMVDKLLGEGKVMKDIMGHFKENYAGQYDGKTVSETIRSKHAN